MTSAALHRLCHNDHAMIRWICGVKPSDDPSMDELHAKLGICDLAILVRERRLRWFGHVMRSNGEINRVRSRPVHGRKGPGRPKKTWEERVKQDLKVCGLSEAGTQDRLSWRSSVKNSQQEPTPSNGSLPQSMTAPPAQRFLGMRTRSFNKTGFDWLIDWIKSYQKQIFGWMYSWNRSLMKIIRKDSYDMFVWMQAKPNLQQFVFEFYSVKIEFGINNWINTVFKNSIPHTLNMHTWTMSTNRWDFQGYEFINYKYIVSLKKSLLTAYLWHHILSYMYMFPDIGSGNGLLPDPVLAYCQMDPLEQTSVQF